MTCMQPEAIARWLDDVDGFACAARLLWGRRPVRRATGRPGAARRLLLPLLVTIVLALGPNVGI